ncbi:hypothetical protein D3C85_1855330 [compost metagenome]
MLATIQFDHQALLQTNEVNDVAPHWLLSLELESEETMPTQVVPEVSLSLSHVAAQFPGEFLEFH